MGSFPGHAVAGSFYLLYGLWWVFLSCLIHAKETNSRKRYGPHPTCTRGTQYSKATKRCSSDDINSRSWLPQPFLAKYPLEPFVKLLVSGLGIVVESCIQITSKGVFLIPHGLTFNENGEITNDLALIPHVTLYLAFAVSGLVDIASLFIALPPHTTQIFLALAFAVKSVLFFFHVQGTEHVGGYVHELSWYLAILCTVFALLRVYDGMKFAINIGLGSCLVLQGAWFIQIGILVYPLNRKKWILPCPEIPEDIDTDDAIREYFATKIEDPERVTNCAVIGRDDNTALFVSSWFVVTLMAVAVLILMVLFITQLIVQKMQQCGWSIQSRSHRVVRCNDGATDGYKDVASHNYDVAGTDNETDDHQMRQAL